ncbi:MAG: 16S rRNA (guanine(527)-N(7))-methyltransferase RsmG [Clostridiales bacterium]|jgi:16S rRNA (guanine527-N7)-methyltransferase|nr:16S rRNA (guanine(527)-N(7))-methyltransferase RsmG [Clostridiales bacterium]
MNQREILASGAAQFGVTLDERALDRFLQYGVCLLEWNQKINLTAITDPEEVAVKHFVDSVALLSIFTPDKGAKVIDIGTGAGFPGVPLKIARPDVEITLLDSLNKRLVFLEELLNGLDLSAQLVHARAEEGGRNPALREGFDWAVSRAVANLRLLAEYCLPYVRVGGIFTAMKGPEVEQELLEAQGAIEVLGGTVERVERFSLPDGSGRTVVVVRKERPTPTAYPRHGSKIAKKPL